MKFYIILICIFISNILFGQEYLIDSIKILQKANTPFKGRTLCTEGYWGAEIDGGERLMKQLCRKSKAELKISDNKTAKNRSVLVVDFLMDGVKRDEVYLFAIKNNNQWFIDGFNETKAMIDYFLKGECSGHFAPTSLAKDKNLEEIATQMLKYTKDIDGLKNFIKEYISEEKMGYNAIPYQFTSELYDEVKLISTGYSKKFNKGFIYFKQTEKEDDYESGISIYVKQIKKDKYTIYNYGFSMPYASSFFKEK